MPLIKKELMDILVCPVDKGELTLLEKDKKLECRKCGLRYPIKEGIPVMLESDAEKPEAEETAE